MHEIIPWIFHVCSLGKFKELKCLYPLITTLFTSLMAFSKTCPIRPSYPNSVVFEILNYAKSLKRN